MARQALGDKWSRDCSWFIEVLACAAILLGKAVRPQRLCAVQGAYKTVAASLALSDHVQRFESMDSGLSCSVPKCSHHDEASFASHILTPKRRCPGQFFFLSWARRKLQDTKAPAESRLTSRVQHLPESWLSKIWNWKNYHLHIDKAN